MVERFQREFWKSALVVRQQAITWTNVDPYLCHHMVPLSHSGLNVHRNSCLHMYIFRYICLLCHQLGSLVQGRRNSIADAMELRLSCTNPSNCFQLPYMQNQLSMELHFLSWYTSSNWYPYLNIYLILTHTKYIVTGNSIWLKTYIRNNGISQYCMIMWDMLAFLTFRNFQQESQIRVFPGLTLLAAEIRTFHENWIFTMAADDLAPWINRAWRATVLNMHNKWILVF